MPKMLVGTLFVFLLLATASSFAEEKKQPLYQLDFDNVEIKEVIKAVSNQTKINFVYGDNVRGKITVVSPEPMTQGELLDLLGHALEIKGFTMIKRENTITIVPTQDARHLAIPIE